MAGSIWCLLHSLNGLPKPILKVIQSEVHQMFGKYNGFVVTDEGKKLEIIDLVGWAEEHKAKW